MRTLAQPVAKQPIKASNTNAYVFRITWSRLVSNLAAQSVWIKLSAITPFMGFVAEMVAADPPIPSALHDPAVDAFDREVRRHVVEPEAAPEFAHL